MTEERKTLWRLIEAVEACSLDEAVKAVQEASMLLAAKPDLEWSGTFVAPILWNGKVQERRLRVYTPAVDRAALATPSPRRRRGVLLLEHRRRRGVRRRRGRVRRRLA